MDRGRIADYRERVFFLSTTNGPEQSALAAGLATIDSIASTTSSRTSTRRARR